MVIVFVVDISEADRIVSQLLHYNSFLFLVTEVVVPRCLADELVLAKKVILVVVALSEEIHLWLEGRGNNSTDTGSSIWNVLSF